MTKTELQNAYQQVLIENLLLDERAVVAERRAVIAERSIEEVSAKNGVLEAAIGEAKAQLAYLQAMLFGRKSERLVDPAQGKLFTDGQIEATASNDDGDAAKEASDLDETITVTYQKKKKTGGRRAISPDLRREVILHERPAEDLIDPVTGELLYEPFGSIDTEKLAFMPPEVYVELHRRVKYRRKQKPDGSHERLEPDDPPEIIEARPTVEGLPGCLAAPSLLAEFLHAKYVMHVPFDRKIKELKRRSDIDIANSTVSGWMMQIAVLAEPLYELMKDLMLRHSHVIQHDDTPVNQLPPKNVTRKRQSCTQSHFWSIVGQPHTAGHYNLFDYTAGRDGEHPRSWFRRGGLTDDEVRAIDNPDVLEKISLFEGVMQCDAYSGYFGFFEPPNPKKGGDAWSMKRSACWAHARRKFYNARISYPGEAGEALDQIKVLYGIEDPLTQERKAILCQHAPGNTFDAEAWWAKRLRVRQEKAAAEVDLFFTWCQKQRDALIPSHMIRKAAEHSLNQEAELRLYLTDGRLEIDNTACERSIRPIAIGRKNWMFTGSEEAGRAAAVLFSLISSAKMHGREPWSYLLGLARHLRGTPAESLHELLPDRWQPPPARGRPSP